jgi:copper chaperone CopZ
LFRTWTTPQKTIEKALTSPKFINHLIKDMLMKYLKFGLMAFMFLVFAASLSAQSCSGDKTKACCSATKAKACTEAGAEAGTAKAVTPTDVALTTATFKVLGNCGMCKRTIESAATSVAGVATANWDQEAKLITVSFDADVATVLQIHQQIAAAGYDTENVRAEDAAYSALHGCCQYERARL